MFPASLGLISLPGPEVEAGVELLVELAALLGEETSRECEGAGLALRTRDPPKFWIEMYTVCSTHFTCRSIKN